MLYFPIFDVRNNTKEENMSVLYDMGVNRCHWLTGLPADAKGKDSTKNSFGYGKFPYCLFDERSSIWHLCKDLGKGMRQNLSSCGLFWVFFPNLDVSRLFSLLLIPFYFPFANESPTIVRAAATALTLGR